MAASEETDHGEPDDLGLADECAADVLLEPAGQVEGVEHGIPLYSGRSGDRCGHRGNKLRMRWPVESANLQTTCQPFRVLVATLGRSDRSQTGAICMPSPRRGHREATAGDTAPAVPAPTPSSGLMRSSTGRAFMEQAPGLAIFPGLAISLAVFGFNLFGDRLRAAWNPKLRRRAERRAPAVVASAGTSKRSTYYAVRTTPPPADSASRCSRAGRCRRGGRPALWSPTASRSRRAARGSWAERSTAGEAAGLGRVRRRPRRRCVRDR